MEVGRYQQGLDFVTLVGLPKESVVIAQVSITYALWVLQPAAILSAITVTTG
jgi:hypothetical protein